MNYKCHDYIINITGNPTTNTAAVQFYSTAVSLLVLLLVLHVQNHHYNNHHQHQQHDFQLTGHLKLKLTRTGALSVMEVGSAPITSVSAVPYVHGGSGSMTSCVCLRQTRKKM